MKEKKNFEKEFDKKGILDLAGFIVKGRKICKNCLGRQFANVSTGLTNNRRGEIILSLISSKEAKACSVCLGMFKKLPKYADNASKLLEKIEFDTFVVGTRMSSDLIVQEESLWEDAGIEYCESIRSELNRELGKLIYDKIKKEVDEKRPDVTVMLNLVKDRIELQIAPVFFKGGYKKLIRGIPQTKWDKYESSVEDVIALPVMKLTQGEGHSMHASGREDIDARCLDFRPFVLEISSPVKRNVDLDNIKKEINKTKKVEVTDLSYSNKSEVVRVKSGRPDKSYEIDVQFKNPVKDITCVKKIIGPIDQQTPKRVAHRRADKVRKRHVYGIKWKEINNKNFKFQIKGEAGLYIKELATGDDGRTEPSIAQILKNPADVKSLDVIKIWKR